MKSHRRMQACLGGYADDGFQRRNYSRDLRQAEWASGVSLRSSNPKPLMSALGQKRTSAAGFAGGASTAGVPHA